VGAQPPRRLDAVDLGHPDVHDDHVGPQLERQVDRLAAVGGLPHDLEVVLGAQHRLEPAAGQRVVVGDDQFDHADASSSIGSRARRT
jgi:hypothetical protein